MTPSLRVPRRAVLEALGLAASGFALGLLGETDASADVASAPAPAAPAAGLRANVFVHVATSGVVTIVCARSEMGQGVRSTLPALVGDELGADPSRIVVVQGDADRAYGDQNTDGSRSVRMDFDKLRRVGAGARTMLVQAAAARWGVPARSCTARDHAVVHVPTGRKLPFGDLAEAAGKLAPPADDAVVLRPRSELRTLGKTLPLLDGPALVTGQARFGADVVLPGMLTAVVARPPVLGARVKAVRRERALAVPGVLHVVDLPEPRPPWHFQPLGGVAVVAKDTWSALRGRAALAIDWDEGENAVYDSVTFERELEDAVSRDGKVVRSTGDTKTALAASPLRLDRVYHAPHLAHAPMEPPVAVARVTAAGCEIWAPTQNPQAARTQVAKSLGIDESKVTVHVTFLGGGFGRKSKADFVAEAALVSRAVGAPVRVQWTREDDLVHDYLHTVSVQRLEAGLDARGDVVALRHRTAFPPIASIFTGTRSPGEGDLQQGVLDVPYAIPNVRAEHGEATAHVRIGWLRSVANIYHAFAVQSFLDEVAHERRKDPRDHLLEMVGPSRLVSPAALGVAKLPNYGQPLDTHPVDVGRYRNVVERVTALSGWGERQAKGRALGLAVHRSFLTYVAVVIGVSRDDAGRLRVDEAFVVADAGTVVNVDRARAQLEGAVMFGLSLALYGSITVKGGRVQQKSLRDFRLLRIGAAPRVVQVELVPSEAPPGGIGEPGVPPVAPALTNAIFALTRTRVRRLPVASAMAVV